MKKPYNIQQDKQLPKLVEALIVYGNTNNIIISGFIKDNNTPNGMWAEFHTNTNKKELFTLIDKYYYKTLEDYLYQPKSKKKPISNLKVKKRQKDDII